MKILVIGPIPPPYGGGEIMMLETIKALKSRGFECHHINTSVRAFNKDRMKLSFKVLLRYVGIYYRIFNKLKNGHFDAVYFSLSKKKPGFIRNIPYILLAKLFKTKIIGHIHGGEFEVMDNPILAFVARKIDIVLVLSEDLKHLLAKKFTDRTTIEYLCNGIEIENKQKTLRPKLDSLIYVGNLVPKKGIIRLAQVFKSLSHKYPYLKLHLVGEWHSNAIQSQFYNIVNGFKPNVIEHGYIPNEKVKDVLPNVGLLIHPTEYDGQPISIIEAFAFGLPVVSSNIGGIPHMIDDGINGFLVKEYTDITSYVNTIESLIADDNKYHAFQRAALKNYNDKFSLHAYGEKIHSIIGSGA
jgi:glycosyltransferase involved in cell wall biosynthesis